MEWVEIGVAGSVHVWLVRAGSSTRGIVGNAASLARPGNVALLGRDIPLAPPGDAAPSANAASASGCRIARLRREARVWR